MTISIAGALLCLNFGLSAQQLKPLKIGQKIPLALWTQPMPVLKGKTQDADSLSLAHYPHKLIVLDFWASWCTTCIYTFDKLEKLQQKYPNQLQILLVNEKNSRDTQQRIIETLKGKKTDRPWDLTSFYNDTTLKQLFPHTYLPHYVWIGANREILALTGIELMNEQTIKTLLATSVQKVNQSNTNRRDRP